MAKLRSEQSEKSTWNLTPMYPNMAAWEKETAVLFAEAKEEWTSLTSFRGRLHEGPQVVKKLLDLYFGKMRLLDKLHTYAHLIRDQDVADEVGKNAYEKMMILYSDFSRVTSWIEPEILERVDHYLKESALHDYKFYLQRLFDQKKHILSSDKEELLALAGRIEGVPSSAFSQLNNADIVFPKVKDSEGHLHELTHGTYQLYMKSEDRVLRENTFRAIHATYSSFRNTLTELLSGKVQGHLFNQKVRKFGSCLEAALSPNNIPVEVYHALVRATKGHTAPLHDYMRLRKKVLGLDELCLWDMMNPLVAGCDKTFSYEEACDIVVESVAILGKEYQEILRAGLKHDRWVDVYENKGKRSGAYSSGCYDSPPYILLNYHGTISDVLTLSHEAGHSMHSYLSKKGQSYVNSRYPIFLAEVASTFHEKLTYEYMQKHASSDEEVLYLMTQQLDGMRGTFFRQSMFAEFELALHEAAEQDRPITPALIQETYMAINRNYFGPDVAMDEAVSFEALRIPHFYYNFYVYQYATGIAAAYHLVDVVKEKGNKGYLEFLSSGASDYPIELLKKAGADMTSEGPVKHFIESFSHLQKELSKKLSVR